MSQNYTGSYGGMMLYRSAIENFEKWKNDDKKKALLVTGARQIGKTFLIREFARKNYKNFVEINFVTQESAKQIFEGDLNADYIIQGITAITKQNLEEGNTLIFFDEIQECPNARTAIKFLVDDGRYDYVESGSLLGVQYKAVKSYPVGYEHVVQMFPMSFREFCIACGLQKQTFQLLEDCFNNLKTVPEAVHNAMKQLFQAYTIVGGMPAVVQEYISSHDIAKVVEIQKDILALYRQDIAKYSDKDKEKITAIFDNIPSQLDSKNRRFKLNSIRSSARMERYEESFIWLKDAGVAIPCYNLVAPQIPLKLNEQSNLFKLYMADVGLLCASCIDNVQYSILNGDLSVNMGSILENLYAQELLAKGFEVRFMNKKFGEIDFVIQNNGKAVPLEIKSGADYTKHTALNNALKVDEWQLKKAFVFCMGNIAQEDSITYLPWYMILFIKKDEIQQNTIFEVPLNGI